MDPKTGEVYQFKTQEEFASAQRQRVEKGEEPLRAIGCLPKSNCRKCYGRGFVGRNVKTGNVIPCSCTQVEERKGFRLFE